MYSVPVHRENKISPKTKGALLPALSSSSGILFSPPSVAFFIQPLPVTAHTKNRHTRGHRVGSGWEWRGQTNALYIFSMGERQMQQSFRARPHFMQHARGSAEQPTAKLPPKSRADTDCKGYGDEGRRQPGPQSQSVALRRGHPQPLKLLQLGGEMRHRRLGSNKHNLRSLPRHCIC